MVGAGQAVAVERYGTRVGNFRRLCVLHLGQQAPRDRRHRIRDIPRLRDVADTVARHENSNALLGKEAQSAEKAQRCTVVPDHLVTGHLQPEEYETEGVAEGCVAGRRHFVEPHLRQDADAVERAAVHQGRMKRPMSVAVDESAPAGDIAMVSKKTRGGRSDRR
jgi:hypothetical protein